MKFALGLEQTEPGKWIAWVVDLPGCFARASARDEVVRCAPRAIADYFNWRDGYERVSSEAIEQMGIEVVEEFRNYETLDGYWVNAFFAWDRRPLLAGEIDDVRWLLSCMRSDLISAVRRVPAAALDQPIAGERFGTIAGILTHAATAERWYLDKLGLAPQKETLGTDPFAMLESVRRHLLMHLPRFANDATVSEGHGEFWSARKVARRALWHERVHTWHIQRLTAQLVNQR